MNGTNLMQKSKMIFCVYKFFSKFYSTDTFSYIWYPQHYWVTVPKKGSEWV